MVFSSYTFLFAFLPLVLFCYYFSPTKFKNFILLAFSLLFYTWGTPFVVLLMIGSCFIDLLLSKHFSGRYKKFYFIVAIVQNIAMLGYFKYSNFFIEQVNLLLETVGVSPIVWIKVALPAGVSFYTFEKISYLVDVYRGIVEPSKSLSKYVLFVSFFPHLIAGPILRYADIIKQINHRTHSWDLFFEGFCRLSIGLARKILIADELGEVVNNVIALPDGQTSVGLAWLGMISYTFQLYFDFSAYSDMAIGLAKMFGFHFNENFNHPFLASSITNFWRRWHISFTTWMRDYVYIPLGGNRGSAFRTYLNLITCFFLSGLWHGASWNFVLWGCFHGLFLIIDRLFLLKYLDRLSVVFTVPFTFTLVVIGFVIFRIETFHEAFGMYKIMFGMSEVTAAVPPVDLVMHFRGALAFIAACVFSFITPNLFRFANFPPFLKGVLAIILFVFAVITLTSSSFHPFLYYQF